MRQVHGWGREICKEVKALPLRRNSNRSATKNRDFIALFAAIASLPQSRSDDEGGKLCAVGAENEKATAVAIAFSFNCGWGREI